jgi:hypothetical protein
MKVIQINEENHGHIGTAVSMKAAFQYLVAAEWLTFNTDIWLFDSWVTISEIFDDNGWHKTKESLVEWAMNRKEEAWDGMFYFSEDELIEED